MDLGRGSPVLCLHNRCLSQPTVIVRSERVTFDKEMRTSSKTCQANHAKRLPILENWSASVTKRRLDRRCSSHCGREGRHGELAPSEPLSGVRAVHSWNVGLPREQGIDSLLVGGGGPARARSRVGVRRQEGRKTRATSIVTCTSAWHNGSVAGSQGQASGGFPEDRT